jgi:ATP-dependent Clp protease protease subunit
MSHDDEDFKVNISSSVEYGIDFTGRRIYLHGDIDPDSVATAIRGIYLLAEQSPNPIQLIITSYGGDIDQAFALHDVIRGVPNYIYTVALGTCMSAAPFLLAAGCPGHRSASENAEFMLHATSLELGGMLGNVEATVKATKRRSEAMDRLLGKYTKKDYRFWAKIGKSAVDHYFGAEQALEWGLIDRIWVDQY